MQPGICSPTPVAANVPAMGFVPLGRSGLKVSRACLGTMTFGNTEWGTDEPESKRIVDSFIDAGHNFIDTADVYNAGISEEIVGRAIAGKRDGVVLATKGYNVMGGGPNDRGSSRAHLTRALEASLRRLGTDYIDLYQLHNWDHDTPIEESMATLDGFVRSGKVRYIGCSNFYGSQLVEAQWAAAPPGRGSPGQPATPVLTDLARHRARHPPHGHPPRDGGHRMEPARRGDAHGQVRHPGRAPGRRSPEQRFGHGSGRDEDAHPHRPQLRDRGRSGQGGRRARFDTDRGQPRPGSSTARASPRSSSDPGRRSAGPESGRIRAGPAPRVGQAPEQGVAAPGRAIPGTCSSRCEGAPTPARQGRVAHVDLGSFRRVAARPGR